MHSHGRSVQARLVRHLMDARAWRRLGFARLSDYARERLGVASRTLEEDARVLRALDRLPLLRSAFDSGALGWSHLRLVVRIACAQNEETLLAKALGSTVRELEEFLRRETGPPLLVEPENDEPTQRWSVGVSRKGRLRWRAACELASRSTGGPLSAAQVLELVAAEALGAAPGRPEPSPPEDCHTDTLPANADLEQARERRVLRAFLAEAGVIDGFAWLERASRDPGPLRSLSRLADNLDSIDAFELDRRLRECRRAMSRIDFQLGALLRAAIDRRLLRDLGFATAALYVECRLGMSSRRIWSLVSIERSSHRCAALRAAWRDGHISHLAACALVPVLTEEHGEAWVCRAGEVTLRRLVDEVTWALDFADRAGAPFPPAPPAPDANIPAGGVEDIAADVTAEELQTCAHEAGANVARLTFYVPLTVALLVETALQQHRRQAETRSATFERLVASAILEWSSAARHRDPIFERDRWRCTVPGCSSRRNLQDHHVLYRSHGGTNARDNRTTVCAAHHLHGIHAGTIRASGRAPSGIVWELGCSRGREPLLRLIGDRYASSSASSARTPT